MHQLQNCNIRYDA